MSRDLGVNRAFGQTGTSAIRFNSTNSPLNRCEDSSHSESIRAKMGGRHPLCFAEARQRTSPSDGGLESEHAHLPRFPRNDGFLRLIGFPVGACRLVFASGHSRLRRFHVRLCGFSFRLSRLMQFVAEFVLCFLKLLHRLTHSTGKFRQLLCSEQDQDNQQDDDQVRPCQIHETGDKAHAVSLNIRLFPKVSRQIP